MVSLEYIRPLAEIEAALPEHIAYLERHYRAGTFLMSGRKQPRTGGVILMQADSREQVEQTIAKDPFHRAGLAEYSITEFLPTKTADSLAQYWVLA
ncbi:TPA: YciI family protein [Neisseria bacilliformis]